MKMLSSEVKSLLDKLYNLRGEDSVILTKMNKEREEAIETQERTKNEKSVLIEKIETLTLEEQNLQEEGQNLTKVLSSINRDDFAIVLDRLQIDFDPESINAKLNSMLPETIEKVVSEKEKASEELKNVEAEMNNAITKVEELGIRKDEALSSQAKLNEYFELALDGNINITRDAITNLLEKFDFNEDEQREAAKILMFPEDALYEYDAEQKSSDKRAGKTITEVLVEAKKESVNTEASNLEPVIESANKESELEDIFDKVIEENSANVVFDKIDLEEEGTKEIVAPLVEENESVLENKGITEKEKLVELLQELEINKDYFDNTELEKILANYDEELIRENVGCLKKHDINLDILVGNVEIIYDKELSGKLEKLLNIGKEAKDISLMPTVLTKYDLQGLNNTINVLQISGLDPKKVPLMAY